MSLVSEVRADLMYDPNDVGSDCVVRCRISNGPPGSGSGFDPAIGDHVRLIDDDAEMLTGRVVDRDGDRVWVQVALDVPLARAV